MTTRAAEVIDVRPVSEPQRGIRFSIDAPRPSAHSSVHALPIKGWVVAHDGAATSIEVVQEGEPIDRIGLGTPRRDVMEEMPDHLRIGNGLPGFSGMVNLVGRPLEGTLKLRVRLDGGDTIPLADVTYRRQVVRGGPAPRLNPLIVSALGRSGTTRLMQLLTAHPNVASGMTYPYEVRVAGYWMHCLRVLSTPFDSIRSQDANFWADRFHVGSNPLYGGPWGQHGNVTEWCGSRYVEQTAAFFQQMIDQVYLQLAEQQGRQSPSFFVEKLNPDHTARLLSEIYPGGKEVFLVRDFRDMVSSMFAFNAKRGTAEFGQSQAQSNADFVERLGRGADNLLACWNQRSARSLLVRYEDLIRDPVHEMGKILSYAGLSFSAASRDAVIAAVGDDSDKLQFHRTTVTPTQSIGRWKSDLDPELLQTCNQVFRGPLEAFGYDVGTAAPTPAH